MGIINKLFGASGGETYDGQGEERSGGIDVIQYNGENSEYVWKFPYNNIVTGARLIVNQSQEAIFPKHFNAVFRARRLAYTSPP